MDAAVRRGRLVFAAVAIATSAAACPSAPLAPLGVWNNNGQVEFLTGRCGGDTAEVTDVSVYDSTEDDVFAKKDQLIWKVRLPLEARRAPQTERITLGELPAGFEELTRLKNDDGKELVVNVNHYQMVFDRAELDELEEGQVLTAGGTAVTEEEFFGTFVPTACRSAGQRHTKGG